MEGKVMEGKKIKWTSFFTQKQLIFLIEDHIDNPAAPQKNVTETLVLALKDSALHLFAML